MWKATSSCSTASASASLALYGSVKMKAQKEQRSFLCLSLRQWFSLSASQRARNPPLHIWRCVSGFAALAGAPAGFLLSSRLSLCWCQPPSSFLPLGRSYYGLNSRQDDSFIFFFSELLWWHATLMLLCDSDILYSIDEDTIFTIYQPFISHFIGLWSVIVPKAIFSLTFCRVSITQGSTDKGLNDSIRALIWFPL